MLFRSLLSVGKAVTPVVAAIVWVEIGVIVRTIAEASTERSNVADAMRVRVVRTDIDALEGSTLYRQQQAMVESGPVRIFKVQKSEVRSGLCVDQGQRPALLHIRRARTWARRCQSELSRAAVAGDECGVIDRLLHPQMCGVASNVSHG